MENYVPMEQPDSDSDGGRKRRKKAKDPNRPKRALSSFMFFATEKRSEVTKEFPDLKVTEVGKKLADKWRALSAEEKKVFYWKAKFSYVLEI